MTTPTLEGAQSSGFLWRQTWTGWITAPECPLDIALFIADIQSQAVHLDLRTVAGAAPCFENRFDVARANATDCRFPLAK